MTQFAPPAGVSAGAVVEIPAVRVRLGAEQPAAQPDPLGRAFIGYAAGLTQSQLWERGRGVWKAKHSSLAEAKLALVVASTAAGQVVVAVGTVDGVSFHGDRSAVVGRVLPGHPLVGQPDPLANSSRNPIAFGQVRTVLPAAGAQRPAEVVLADAVRVLTEAARLRRHRLRQSAGGQWEPDPEHTEPADWAEFVTLTLAGVAANVGGIDIALAGRPGSWEADENRLWEHRTEPVAITLYVEELLGERCDIHTQYDDAVAEIERRCTAAIEQAGLDYDSSDYAWVYTRTEAGDWIAADPAAPAWSWEAWREGAAASGASAELIAQIERYLRDGSLQDTALIPKSAEAGAEMDRRQQAEDRIRDTFEQLQERLEQQRRREWADYGAALKAHIEAAAAAVDGLTVPVDVRVDIDTYRPAPGLDELWGLETRLVDQASADTPTPADLAGTPLDRLEQA